MSNLHKVVPPQSEATHHGYEPTWNGVGENPVQITEQNKKSELQRGLNWHSFIADKKDYIKYVEEWIKETRPKTAKKDLVAWNKVPEKIITNTYPTIARMILQGYPIQKSIIQELNDWIDELIEEYKHSKKEENGIERVSVQDRMRAQVSPVLSELDVVMDTIIDGKKPTEEWKNKLDKSEFKTPHLAFIEKYLTKNIEEWEEAIDAMDKKYQNDTSIQLAEAYKSTGKKKLKEMSILFRTIRQSIDKKVETVKVDRIRHKKPVDKAKLVKKLKYLKTEPKLKLESIKPIELLGTSTVWTYDTIKRKLAFHQSSTTGNIHVKGTTLIGVDVSGQKILRKPETQLPEFMKLRKWTTQKEWFDDVKAVEQPVKGRTNDGLLLLKAE